MTKKNNQFGSVSELTTGNFDPDKLYQFWLVKRNEDTSYAEDKGQKKVKHNIYPKTYPLKLEFKTRALNPETKKIEPVFVRHCVGEMSIFKHLQTADDKVPKSITKKMFVDGYFNVYGTDDLMLQALAIDDRNGSKPNRDTTVPIVYFQRDEEKIQDAAIAVDDAKFEVESYIRDMANYDSVCAYARIILTESEYDKLSVNPKVLIQRMVGFSKGNPALYMQGFINPATLQLHYVLEAKEQNKITFNEATNAIYFKDGSLIQLAPMGTDPFKLFVERITTDTTNVTAQKYQTILGLLPNYKKVEKEEAPRNDAKPGKQMTEEEIATHALIEKGKEAGIITFYGAAGLVWAVGTKDQRKFTGWRKFQSAMNDEEEFATLVRTTLA